MASMLAILLCEHGILAKGMRDTCDARHAKSVCDKRLSPVHTLTGNRAMI